MVRHSGRATGQNDDHDSTRRLSTEGVSRATIFCSGRIVSRRGLQLVRRLAPLPRAFIPSEVWQHRCCTTIRAVFARGLATVIAARFQSQVALLDPPRWRAGTTTQRESLSGRFPYKLGERTAEPPRGRRITRICRARPSILSAQIPYQLKSISYHLSPCRADTGCA